MLTDTVLYIVIAFLIMLMGMTIILFILLMKKTFNAKTVQDRIYLLKMGKDGKMKIKALSPTEQTYWKNYPKDKNSS